MKSNKVIVGFAGRQRSGKTCLSKYLQDTRNGEIVTVAMPLKRMVADILSSDINTLNENKNKRRLLYQAYPETSTENWKCYAIEKLNQAIGAPTELIADVLSKFNENTTVRDVLQVIGTDIIRVYNPNWHVEQLTKNIINSTAPIVAVDDIRFPNEREAVEKLGGTVFFIVRPDLTIPISNHESETSLRWQDFDSSKIILNCYSKEFWFNEFSNYLDSLSTFPSYTPIIMKYGEYSFTNDNLFTTFNFENAEEERLVKICFESAKKHNGAIIVYSDSFETTRMLQKILYKQPHTYIVDDYHKFIVWDPLIIENMKFYY